VIALVADLADEQVRPRMSLDQPADANVRRRVERVRLGRIEARRGLQDRGGVRGRLRELDHVAGVHPPAGQIEVLTGVRARRDLRVVQVRRAV
jgi:hypothetical protein